VSRVTAGVDVALAVGDYLHVGAETYIVSVHEPLAGAHNGFVAFRRASAYSPRFEY